MNRFQNKTNKINNIINFYQKNFIEIYLNKYFEIIFMESLYLG